MLWRTLALGLGLTLATIGLLAIAYAVGGQGWWFGLPCIVVGALVALPGLAFFRWSGWRELVSALAIVVASHAALLLAPEFHLVFVRQALGEGPLPRLGPTKRTELPGRSGLTVRLLAKRPGQQVLEIECEGSVQELAYLAMPRRGEVVIRQTSRVVHAAGVAMIGAQALLAGCSDGDASRRPASPAKPAEVSRAAGPSAPAVREDPWATDRNVMCQTQRQVDRAGSDPSLANDLKAAIRTKDWDEVRELVYWRAADPAGLTLEELQRLRVIRLSMQLYPAAIDGDVERIEGLVA